MNVTPPEPLWLAGYAARTKPAGGKVSELRASALALEDESGGRLVIAAIDLIAVTRTLAEAVYEAVHRRLGLPRERLVLAASHTHYGPEVRPDKATFFRIPAEYESKIAPAAQGMIDALVRVIVEASAAMVPVRIFARRGTAGFAHNRRRQGLKGGTPSSEDVLDQDVSVLDIIHAPTGERKAVVFGYACHNTTIPPEDGRYCADWAGFAKEELERLNNHATALFVAGCGADQNPEPRGSIELSRRYGIELANAVQESLLRDEGAVALTGSIRAAQEDVPLPMRVPTRQVLDEMLAAGASDPPQAVKARFLLDQLDRGEALIEQYAAPMQAIGLGEQLLWIVMSGEPVVDWSHRFKRDFAAAAPVVWVSGYCNDMPGYIPTQRIQQEGGYEGGRANLWSWLPGPWTSDVEDRIAEAIGRVVRSISPP